MKRHILFFLIIISNLYANKINLKCIQNDNKEIVITFRNKIKNIKNIILYRSTSDLDYIVLEIYEYPITKIKLNRDADLFTDKHFADNVRYYYQLRFYLEKDKFVESKVVSINIRNKEIGNLNKPSIFVDKNNYILELRDNNKIIKTYPTALGQNPIKRKLHQDNSSTPEGFYKIVNLRPVATYYKAYDINYPNKIDWLRYSFFKKNKRLPSIGGFIQIHGMGIENNWTWGCIALRNSDIDELFKFKNININTKIIIAGREIGRDDISAIKEHINKNTILKIQQKLIESGYYKKQKDGKLNKYTRGCIAKYQKNKNLKITFELDSRTIKSLDLK
jgi:murein L,D-transpeptidase YafK